MFKIDFSVADNDVLSKRAAEKLAGNIEDWERCIWDFIAKLCNPLIQHINISSSGSTGTPKQIKHSKETIFNSALMTCKALNLKPGNTALLSLPANKIGGMMMIARCFCDKMDLYCSKPSSNPIANFKSDLRIDFAAFTPMQFYEILSNDKTYKKVETISKIILGGQTTGVELEGRIAKMVNDIYLTFGMTETISHIALKKLSGKHPDRYYTLLPEVKISVDDRNCMVIDAPKLGCSHLITNDIVRIVSDNQFEWIGRWDNVINSGGIKIFPEEIEQKLLPYIKHDFFMSAIDDNKLGQKLILAIETEKFDDKENEELTGALTQLDKIHRPKEIWLIRAFIKTENGKIKRAESLSIVAQTIPV